MDSQDHHEWNQRSCNQEQSICERQSDETLETSCIWWTTESWNVSWFRECPQSPNQVGGNIRLCYPRARRHWSFVRAIASALVPFEIDISFGSFFVALVIFVSAAFWIRLRLVATRPTVRTTISVARIVVTRPTVRATYFCTERDGRNQWHELIRTVLKQPNHHCPESAERIIRRNDSSQSSTTIPRHSRRKLSPTLKWGHSQPMDQIWHATCSRLLSLFREHQVHQWSNCGSPGGRLQAAAEIAGHWEEMFRMGVHIKRIKIREGLRQQMPTRRCNDGTLHGQGDLRQTWWTLDCFV